MIMGEIARRFFQQEGHIRKSILVSLIAVMIATPCLAQEVEPDGLFSIEGTEWRGVGFPLGIQMALRFYEGNIYLNLGVPWSPSVILTLDGTYLDLLVVSFFEGTSSSGRTTVFGMMQPTGIGVVVLIRRSETSLPKIDIRMLIKVDDD